MRKTIITALALILILAHSGFLYGNEAETISGKTRLQKALFAEVAERDLPKAAKEYEGLVQEYAEARKIGLSALYRLAEVRRKQKRNEDAAKLYQRVASEFPETPEARLSRENLTALGVGLPAEPKRIPEDPNETKELRRLMMLAKNSPERMWDEVPLALNDIGSQTTSPLSKAARRGWLRVVAFLLEDHKKSGRKQRELDLALYSTARAGQVDSCRLLLAHGATLAVAKNALVEVIQSNHQAVGDWLLEQGVDINTVGQGHLYSLDRHRRKQRNSYTGEDRAVLASAYVRLSPLSAAISADDPEWIDRLLKLGTGVNHEGPKDWEVEISPLSIACWKGHAPLVKRLLDLGADPNCPDKLSSQGKEIRKPASTAEGWRPLHYAAGKPEIVAMLLAAGANAQGADAEGFTPLHAAASLSAAKSCEALLKAGAACDPAVKLSWLGDKKWSPIMLASAHANEDDGGAAAKEVIQMLIESGADPSPENLAPRDIIELCPVTKLRFWLAEIIRYPDLARTQGITVVLPAAPATHVLVTHPGDGSAPPSLAEAMLGWVSNMIMPGNETHRMDRGFVRRSDKNGQFQKLPFSLTDISSHPKLQWGDLVEFAPVEMDAKAYVFPWVTTGRPVSVRTSPVALDPAVYLGIFDQMEITITITWSDRPQQKLKLRGGLRVYDPGRSEAPLVSPAALLDLLGGSSLQTLKITRSEEHGGGTIDVPKDPEFALGIRFRDGDVMTVGALAPEEAKERREVWIQLLEPASGFRWTQWVSRDGNPGRELSKAGEGIIKPAIYPTLFQFLTEFYLPLETFELESMSEILAKEEDFKKWNPDEVARAVKFSGVAPWATIRHPDLREIWIDRLGGERIRVPLAELIAKTNDETPNEFYRKADLELQAGDIVEIRLLPDHGVKPWKGFDPETTQFIQKALTYNFKRGDTIEDGISHRVQWAAPHWFETSIGPVAIGKTADKPFILDVNEFSRAWAGTFKWGLKERWLRQDILIQHKLGRSNMVAKSRLGGSSDYPHSERHSGLDGRGLLSSLRPRLIRKETSSKIRKSFFSVPGPK